MQEHEFILNTARINPVGQADLNVLNWQYILDQAKEHNVAPLLYNNIRNLPVPGPILKEFEKIYTYTAFHNMLFLDELQKILEKINAVVLKGPKLAVDVYGNIGLRPFLDMDLLIRKEELEEVKAALRSMGYITRDEDFYKKYHFLMPFAKPGKIPINIDLQWDFVDRFILHRIDMDMIWSKVRENSLPPYINILYLILHIEKHALFNKVIYNKGNPRDWIFMNSCGNKLIWFTDLYESIKKYNIDLKELQYIAEEWCIHNIVYYNLYILNKLYPISVLDHLPQPRLGLPKRLIYNMVLSNAKFKLHTDIHIRPIRMVDLVNYLFPSPNIIKKYYCKKSLIPAIIMHFLIGLLKIFREFLGICNLMLFINKKKGSPAAG